jgi:DNA-binding NarL/FixJ family response regulator
MINIIIADDHKLFRSGLIELLKKHSNFNIVSEFEDGNELLHYILKNKNIDVILLDINMPNCDGFEVLEKLSKINTEIKPIIISMYDDGNYIAKSAKLGAYGYLLKNADEDEVVKTITKAALNKKYFGPKISEKMINFMASNQVSLKKISNKESEVLSLISKGLTTKQIAKKLFVSNRTIETHRANLLRKLEVKNTASLIQKAIEHKLL